ncbi:anti-phage-associated DUF3780 domain-containing protein [Methylobacterium aquaticum]|uniref:DUF3780 domain-containing protein n=1 Tax=Methylobacterium aquaticum TaxID=270351 RepID=A0A0C6EZX4_9HYPH|nr:anti-phage-associated DUF3780 domain-containing protein [Methylobacterium aquaticum]BAQ45811.1 hypothetical protein Maq22A_c12880 [Methylobacterium aquaticum]
MTQRPTVGFGCPNEMDPHHFSVTIPAGNTAEVIVTEHFGLRGGANGLPDELVRCRLPRTVWRAIADDLRRVFNERLKDSGLPTSRWSTGMNKVERLLGKELCVLTWSTERAETGLIPGAVKRWVGLRPEERWWLFAMASRSTGNAEDADIGWRKALRVALTEEPSTDEVIEIRKVRRKPPRDERPTLPLFDE